MNELEHIFALEVADHLPAINSCKSLSEIRERVREIEASTRKPNLSLHCHQSLVEAAVKFGNPFGLSNYEPIPSVYQDLGVHGSATNTNGDKCTVVVIPLSHPDSPLTDIDCRLTAFLSWSAMHHKVDIHKKETLFVFSDAVGIHPKTKADFVEGPCQDSVRFIWGSEFDSIYNNPTFLDCYKKALVRTAAEKPKLKVLRKDQRQGVDNLWKVKIGYATVATSGGKTPMEAELIYRTFKRYRSKKGWFVPVVLVAEPRIILAAQVYREEFVPYLMGRGIKYKCVFLNSSSYDDEKDLEKAKRCYGIQGLNVPSTTSPFDLYKIYKECLAEGVPLLIMATYHSAYRVDGDENGKYRIPTTTKIADECQTLLYRIGRFSNDSKDAWHTIKAKRCYSFTATPEFEKDGSGMEYEKKWGKRVVDISAATLIREGVIVKPQLLIATVSAAEILDNQNVSREIDLSDPDAGKNIEVVATALLKVFEKVKNLSRHESSNPDNLGTKILIICKGEPSLSGLIWNSKTIQDYRHSNLKWHLVAISSATGCYYDGAAIEPSDPSFRDRFLDILDPNPKSNGMKEGEDALVLNIDMVNVGMNAPGMLGVCPLRNVKGSNLKQAIGRVMRPHYDDVARMYDGTGSVFPVKDPVKKHAWVIMIRFPWDSNEEYIEHVKEVYKQLTEITETVPEIVHTEESKEGSDATELHSQSNLPSGSVLTRMDIEFMIHEPEIRKTISEVSEIVATNKNAKQILKEEWKKYE